MYMQALLGYLSLFRRGTDWDKPNIAKKGRDTLHTTSHDFCAMFFILFGDLLSGSFVTRMQVTQFFQGIILSDRSRHCDKT